MNKFLILALSVLLSGFNFAIPASAHCGMCEEDQAAEPSKTDAAKKEKHEAKHNKSQDERVSELEKSLKDVDCGGCDAAGSPFTSKSKAPTKSACPKSK